MFWKNTRLTCTSNYTTRKTKTLTNLSTWISAFSGVSRRQLAFPVSSRPLRESSSSFSSWSPRSMILYLHRLCLNKARNPLYVSYFIFSGSVFDGCDGREDWKLKPLCIWPRRCRWVRRLRCRLTQFLCLKLWFLRWLQMLIWSKIVKRWLLHDLRLQLASKI